MKWISSEERGNARVDLVLVVLDKLMKPKYGLAQADNVMDEE